MGQNDEVARIPFEDGVSMAETVAHIQTQLTQESQPVHYGVEGSKGFYRVTNIGEHWTCSCPDYVYRLNQCKHIRSGQLGQLVPQGE